MLPARKSRVRRALLFWYIRRALRHHFDAIRLHGDHPDLHTDTAYPLVVYSTHATWWDGFLEVPLLTRYSHDFHLMMEERNLRKFPAFQFAGVFGVDLDSASGRAAALKYAAQRLRQPGGRRTVYLYPHGRLVPAYAPWPDFGRGVEALLRLCPDAHALPVAKELVHGKFRDPEAFLELGTPLRGDSPALEQALLATRDRLRARIASGTADVGAVELLPPKRWATGRT